MNMTFCFKNAALYTRVIVKHLLNKYALLCNKIFYEKNAANIRSSKLMKVYIIKYITPIFEQIRHIFNSLHSHWIYWITLVLNLSLKLRVIQAYLSNRAWAEYLLFKSLKNGSVNNTMAVPFSSSLHFEC